MNDKPTEGIDPILSLILFSASAVWIWRAWTWTHSTALSVWESYPILTATVAGAFVLSVTALLAAVWHNRRMSISDELAVIEKDDTSVYLGKSIDGSPVHLKQRYRSTHTQVIGTTSVGKTESVILPWAIRDLETGAGLLIIDGKADRTFLEKFYAYAVRSNRKSDFRLFSLALPELSSTFNPLVGGSPYEICERVFSAFTFENEYYRNQQYKLFHLLIQLVTGAGEVPTFLLVRRLLTDSDLLLTWIDDCRDLDLKRELQAFLREPDRTRLEKISGLDTQLSHFCSGELSELFNAVAPQIQIDEVLRENLICYFQLPSMLMPHLASATGKLVLQSLQSAVSRRHVGLSAKPGFFSCYLDDFQDYIYEGFGALLNKSRSANVGVVFSHQALGDLDKVSPAFRNVVLTNTNIKCVMRSNDPDTCEYFGKSFGTRTTEKVTERRKVSFFGETRPGDGSVRDAEEFEIHPNVIRKLGTGQGVVTIPHFKGVKTLQVRFARREDIDPIRLPTILKAPAPHSIPRHSQPQKTPVGSRLTPDELSQSKEA